jgi:hypothetical protein
LDRSVPGAFAFAARPAAEKEPLQRWQRRRAETLLLHAAGVSASASARLLEVHPHTTYADLHAFRRQGLG